VSKKKPLITDQNNPLMRHSVVTPVDPYKLPEAEESGGEPEPVKVEQTPPPAAPPKKDPKQGLRQYGTYLRPETIKSLKRYAFDEEIPDYQVVQSAVEEFLKRHKA
jgi:hypothetical protein